MFEERKYSGRSSGSRASGGGRSLMPPEPYVPGIMEGRPLSPRWQMLDKVTKVAEGESGNVFEVTIYGGGTYFLKVGNNSRESLKEAYATNFIHIMGEETGVYVPVTQYCPRGERDYNDLFLRLKFEEGEGEDKWAELLRKKLTDLKTKGFLLMEKVVGETRVPDHCDPASVEWYEKHPEVSVWIGQMLGMDVVMGNWDRFLQIFHPENFLFLPKSQGVMAIDQTVSFNMLNDFTNRVLHSDGELMKTVSPHTMRCNTADNDNYEEGAFGLSRLANSEKFMLAGQVSEKLGVLLKDFTQKFLAGGSGDSAIFSWFFPTMEINFMPDMALMEAGFMQALLSITRSPDLMDKLTKANPSSGFFEESKGVGMNVRKLSRLLEESEVRKKARGLIARIFQEKSLDPADFVRK
ncbi:hypothetical protein FUAX_51950 (plasmid) [Fulvitalea axinellae]|uniref:Actin-fragmin kinase catalytic domain-containing protein n=1 Tax=Fulvitalea axinellae TaxID=1182444 RepID=A0AAU9CRI5_9BACT|nr:hypothetical protein FUAX_51950 [Fulvitalea axinellae]